MSYGVQIFGTDGKDNVSIPRPRFVLDSITPDASGSKSYPYNAAKDEIEVVFVRKGYSGTFVSSATFNNGVLNWTVANNSNFSHGPNTVVLLKSVRQ